MEVKFHSFLSFTPERGEWSASYSGLFSHDRTVGWSPELVCTWWRREKFLPYHESNPNRYFTDLAIPALVTG